MFKKVQLADGSQLTLAKFLVQFGPDSNKWPDHMACPGCGAHAAPLLLKGETELQAKYDRARQNSAYFVGSFAHTGNEPETKHCPSLLEAEDLNKKDRLPTRFQQLRDFEYDYRMRPQVLDALNTPYIRDMNNKKLGALLYMGGPVNCMTMPAADKLVSLPVLAFIPEAFPLLLAVTADRFKYRAVSTRRDFDALYRTDNNPYDKGHAIDYKDFDGKNARVVMPRHVVLCFADTLKPIIKPNEMPMRRFELPSKVTAAMTAHATVPDISLPATPHRPKKTKETKETQLTFALTGEAPPQPRS